MSKKSRRDFLKIGGVTVAMASVFPQFPIPGLTPIAVRAAGFSPGGDDEIITLEKLAAEGKFCSSPLNIPANVHKVDYVFYLDGVKQNNIFLTEVYAPGDDTGWAVVYRGRGDKGHLLGEDGEPIMDVVRGNWRFEIVDDPELRTKAPQHIPGVY